MRSWIVVILLMACPRTPERPPVGPSPPPERDAALEPDAAIEVAVDAPADLACEPYDRTNPACRGDPRACLNGDADCKCPHPPDAENPACWAVMPCPRVPDIRIRACKPRWPTCPDTDNPDPTNPNCPQSTLMTRVIKFQSTPAGDAYVTLPIGTSQGISKRWKATLLRGDSGDPLPDGHITLVRVDLKVSLGKVRVGEDVVLANHRVRLSAP